MRRTFVLLELMNHMVLVAEEAKRRGFDIVAVNRDPLRTSGPFAVRPGLVDEVVPVRSWADDDHVAAVLDDVLSRFDIGGTYAAFEGTLPHDARLRRAVGLPHNDPETLIRLLDKAAARRHLRDAGLSQLRSMSLADARQLTSSPFAVPAVLKPAHGTGSVLCAVVSTLDELRAAIERADSAAVSSPLMRDYVGSHGDFTLEEAAHGELLSMESFVHGGEVHALGLIGRYLLADDPVVETGWTFPYHHPRYDDIVAAVTAFHHSLGYRQGPTHVEVMVPESGPIELIDFNPRIAGTASLILFNHAFGTRYQEQITDVACGAAPDLSALRRPTRYACEMLLLPPPGVTELRDVTFPPGVVFERLTKDPGTTLSGRADQMDHVAMFVVCGDTAETVHERALLARSATLVNGEPLGTNPTNRLTFSDCMGRSLTAAR